MAYIDDNNNNLHTGSDPLEDLDSELADLRKTIESLEAEGRLPEKKEPESPKPAYKPAYKPEQTAPTVNTAPAPAQKPAEAVKPPVKKPDKPTHFEPDNGSKKRSGSSKVAVLIISILLLIGVIAGAVYGIGFLVKQGDQGDTVATSDGQPVTISDSVMGDIDLQPAKGAEINTKTAENLITEDNGLPAYYQDGKKISHIGIDLSEYQGEVDFAKAKAAGVEFVILRIGGRYYGDDGGLYEDGAFDSYYEQAKAAGLKVGAYFFSQAISAEDAKEEAEFAVKKLNGKSLDYPIAFDWENIADENARTDNITNDELTVIAETFCDTIIGEGYKAIVYANTEQMFIRYDFETMKDYDFWLADYREFPNMYYNFDMWQYATAGQIDGVDGNVDMNISFTDFD